MGREGKLAVGALLLVVAGVVIFASSQVPSKPGAEPLISPTAIAAVFGVPGLDHERPASPARRTSGERQARTGQVI